MNKNVKKLAILSLILPVFIAQQVQAFPGKNALKKAGYAGAAIAAAYAGYKAAQAYGLFGQSERAPIVPVQANPAVKTAQQLLEENQIKLIDARIAERIAKKALIQQVKEEEKNKSALETQVGTFQNLLAQRTSEAQELQKAVSAKDLEIEQLAHLNTNLLGQLSKTEVTTQPALPVTIVSSPAASALPGEKEAIEPIFDLTQEYIKKLKTNATNVGSMIHVSRKAFDGFAPFLQQHYSDDKVLIKYGATYSIIKECQVIMQSFNEMMKDPQFDLSQPHALKQAASALETLYTACNIINSSLPEFRTKIADKAKANWSEWMKDRDAQILEEFDSYKLSFEHRLQQLQPIKEKIALV